MSERTSNVYIRVSKEADGRTVKRELMVDGYKIAELSYLDVLEAAMQFTSSLRFKDGQA